MRLFIAIRMNDDMKKAAGALCGSLRLSGVRGNFTAWDNLHLTLAFLGEVVNSELVEAVLKGILFSPFRLEFDTCGRFGRTFWVGVKPSPALERLASNVRSALDGASLSYDRKPFRPHITLVREVNGLRAKPCVSPVGMDVTRVSLMKSERIRGRLVYTEIFGTDSITQR